eukprot:scaffold13511_cov83-Cylindrotheca_fusiformis.AAC.1
MVALTTESTPVSLTLSLLGIGPVVVRCFLGFLFPILAIVIGLGSTLAFAFSFGGWFPIISRFDPFLDELDEIGQRFVHGLISVLAHERVVVVRQSILDALDSS